MLVEAILLVLLGVAVATFGTLVGAGGGFILVPALLLLHPGREPATIAAMSLVVVLTTGVSGSVAFARQRRVDVLSAAILGAATIPGAVGGALVLDLVPRRLFSAGFAGLLVVITVYLLRRGSFAAIREPLSGRGVLTRMVRDREGDTFLYSYRVWQGALQSTAVSFIGNLAGIGGGVMQVPLMISTLRFPVHIAVATSPVILTFTALQGILIHVGTGNLGLDGDLGEAALIAVGALAGAQAGARLSRHLRGPILLRILMLVLVGVAARLLWSAISG